MSIFSGPQGPGAMARHREKKREEALARNKSPEEKLLMDIFMAGEDEEE